MEKLTSIRYEEIIRELKKLGFRFYRSGRGSHELWVRDSDGKVLPVPKHKGRDMKKGTLKAMIRELGISIDELLISVIFLTFFNTLFLIEASHLFRALYNQSLSKGSKHSEKWRR